MTAPLDIYANVVAEVAARLDLREPNRDAVQSLAWSLSQYYEVDEASPPFEAVIDSATGVGKTYVLTGAMETLVTAYGVQDFAVITPGRTILDKTLANFTPGHPKSLLGPLSFSPTVITSDNFNTPAMRAAMDDDTQVKVYLFTVQSLVRPNNANGGRKTHKFQEGLGGEFYERLQKASQLVVFADEHHCYFGPAFSQAVRDLEPWALVGLTATPDRKTPADQIIFRYPLAAAIADKLVKTPVIVGRKDDRRDDFTKLADGATLLRAKAEAIEAYVAATGAQATNPVMLVVAKDTAEANEYGEILASDEFYGGDYANSVLVVHSKSPDDALAMLETIEDPASPVRIVISVGMLKEGWDVRNVYVIASMRASVSDVLTEQTLGRGMRLPFGAYTGVELLDTLEVVAHERYEDLLKKAGVLNQAFVDYRTRAVLVKNAKGETVARTETVEGPGPEVQTVAGAGASLSTAAGNSSTSPMMPAHAVPEAGGDGGTGSVAVGMKLTDTEDRKAEAERASTTLRQEIARRTDVDPIVVPLLRMTAVKADFSLADITDADAFWKLGAALASDPDVELRRMLVGAKVVTGPDGIRRTVTVTSAAADKVQGATSLFPVEELRARLAEMVLASPAVPAYKRERRALTPLLDAFFEGLGLKAEAVLSANLDRAGIRLVHLVETEQRKVMAKPKYDEVVETKTFSPQRVNDREVSEDRHGAFSKSSAYNRWRRSLYSLAWFDSRPERDVANILDEDDAVALWVRLHLKDLPILWNSAGNDYNPDFLVVETNGTHWVVEVKANKDIETVDVQAKRQAAKRWANHVSSDEAVQVTWRYLLASEADIDQAKGSWASLKSLGT